MNRRHLTIALLVLACARDSSLPAGEVTSASDPAMQHYEIRFEQLPAPFASTSAGNPPVVEMAPPNATLHVPPRFHASLYASLPRIPAARPAPTPKPAAELGRNAAA